MRPRLTVRRLMLFVLIVAIYTWGIREISRGSPHAMLIACTLFLISAFVPVLVLDTLLGEER